MIESNAARVLLDFVQSNDPQVRRNTLTALASSQIADRFKVLVRAGISDSDLLVRQRAMDEIAWSESADQAGYSAALSEVIASGSNGLNAYRMAGGLHSLNVPVVLSISWFTKLRMAFLERWSTAGRVSGAVKMAFIVGNLSWILVLVYLLALTDSKLEGDPAQALLLSGMLAPGFLVLFTRRWWRPIQAEGDRWVALCLELLLLAMTGALIGALASKIPFDSLKDKSTPMTTTMGTVMGALSFCATRAGTILSHGALKGVVLNRFIQFFAGFSAGLIVLTVIAAGIGSTADPVTSGVWVMLVPVLAGLAAAFARADFEAYSKTGVRRIAGLAALPATVLLLVVLALLSALPFIPDNPRVQTTTQGKIQTTTIVAEALPISQAFPSQAIPVHSAQVISLSVSRVPRGSKDLTLRFSQTGSPSTGYVREVSGPKPVLSDQRVEPANTYQVTLTAQDFRSLDAKITLAQTLSTLASRTRRGFLTLAHLGAYSITIQARPITSRNDALQQAMAGSDLAGTRYKPPFKDPFTKEAVAHDPSER